MYIINFYNLILMIEFNNLNQDVPYLLFKEKYDEAIDADQNDIEAISISSLDASVKFL